MPQDNSVRIKSQPQLQQKVNQNYQLQEKSERSPEQKAEIERIGKADTYYILDRDEELFAWLNDQRDLRLCGYIVASEGSGLYKACQFYRILHVKRRGSLFEIPATVMYVEIEQNGNPTELYESILKEFGHPLAGFGRLRDLRSRTWGTLKRYGVKILIIGNAQYLKLKALNELIDLFRNLRIPVILAGTHDLENIFERNSLPYVRVHDSFLEFHEFSNLTFDDVVKVIDDWEKKFLPKTYQLNLTEKLEVVETLKNKSDGLIESLYDLLRQIVMFRIDDSQFELSPSNLNAYLSRRKQPRIKLMTK